MRPGKPTQSIATLMGSHRRRRTLPTWGRARALRIPKSSRVPPTVSDGSAPNGSTTGRLDAMSKSGAARWEWVGWYGGTPAWQSMAKIETSLGRPDRWAIRVVLGLARWECKASARTRCSVKATTQRKNVHQRVNTKLPPHLPCPAHPPHVWALPAASSSKMGATMLHGRSGLRKNGFHCARCGYIFVKDK